MTLEMGKLLRAAEEEITKCAKGCRFYAENAERFLSQQEIPTETAYVATEEITARSHPAAAVEDQGLARHVRRRIGRQKYRGSSHVHRQTVAVQRRVGH